MRLNKRLQRRLIESVCGADARVLERINIDHTITKIEEFVNEIPPFYRFCYRISLWVIQYAIPPLAWKLRPFSSLSDGQCSKYLESWRSSRFYFKRILFKLPVIVCVLNIYSNRSLLDEMGFGKSLQHREAPVLGADGRVRCK